MKRAKAILHQKSGVAMAVLLVALTVIMALVAALLASSGSLVAQAQTQTMQDRAAAQAYSFGETLCTLMETSVTEENKNEEAFLQAAALQNWTNRAVTYIGNDMDRDKLFQIGYTTRAEAPAPRDGLGDITLYVHRESQLEGDDGAAAPEESEAQSFENRYRLTNPHVDYVLWLTVMCTINDAQATNTTVYSRTARYAVKYRHKTKDQQFWYDENRDKWYRNAGMTEEEPFADTASKETFESDIEVTRDANAAITYTYSFDRRENL